MSDFEPSPRESKRRRTTSYSINRTHIGSAEKSRTPSTRTQTAAVSSEKRASRRLNGAGTAQEDIDSAYGSKEDSLIDDEAAAAQLNGEAEQDTPMLDGGTAVEEQDEDAVEIPETPGTNAAQLKTLKRRSERPQAIVATPTEIDEAIGVDAPSAKARTKRRSTANEAGPAKNQTKTQHTNEIEEVTTTGPAALVIEESEDELQNGDEATPVRNLSARTRRRPRRYSNEPQQQAEDPTPTSTRQSSQVRTAASTPQPKGILTPSKGRRNAQRKSVAFGSAEKDIEQQLGFKDIEQSVKKKRTSTKAKAPIAADPDEDEEDETRTEPSAPATTGTEIDPLLEFEQPLDMLQSLQLPSKLPSVDEVIDSDSIVAIKAHVLSRLTSATRCAPASHLATQQSSLTNLLTSTIISGESNSLLMLGPRGAGKTLLLEHVLDKLQEEHGSLFHTVRLNGFFQTDDRLALREIWRQLGRETQELDGGDLAAAPMSYADTLASLLSLLSHPDEMDVDVTDGDDADPEAPLKTAKSTIIILDEFDLFTLHPRQTLLYNLFDIAQSRKAPIAVVGCSTRMDVVESLEKRVKSRFSHRWLHIPPVRTLAEMTAIVESALTIEPSSDDPSAMEGQEGPHTDDILAWNTYIKTSFLPSLLTTNILTQAFHTTKSIPQTLISLYPAIATLNIDNNRLTKHTTSQPPLPLPTHTLLTTTLPHLPLLHLSLLATLSSPSYPSPLPSFHTTHAHYLFLLARTKLLDSSAAHRRRGALSSTTSGSSSSSSGASGVRQWNREMCVGAWEEMVRWGVLTPQGGGGEGMDEWEGVRAEVEAEEVLWVLKQREGVGGVGSIGVGVLGRWVRGEVH